MGKLGYMHPSAIRHLQGFYGPRTTASVAQIAKSIGCTGGGVFTDRVRAHLLQRLESANRCQPQRTTQVAIPVRYLRKVATLVPKKVSVSVPVPVLAKMSVPAPSTKVSAPVPVPTKLPVPVSVSTTVSAPEPTKVSAPEPTTVSAPVLEPTTVSAPVSELTTVSEPVPTTVSVSAPVPVPTTVSVSVPTTVVPTTVPAPAPTQLPVSVSTKVQQLLDMGFALPVETLVNVLAAANDDVGAALTALVGC